MMKKRNVRKRRAIDEEDENSPSGDEKQDKPVLTAEEIRLLQKQRKRKIGVDATALANGSDSNPYIPQIHPNNNNDNDASILQTAFNKEKQQTRNTEEDPAMMGYIEEQINQRLGTQKNTITTTTHNKPVRTIEEEALLAVAPKQKTVDVDLDAAFITGVAEVPLAMEHRLKNIEATETAKAQLLNKVLHGGGGGGSGGVVAVGGSNSSHGGGLLSSESLHRSLYPSHFGRQRDDEAEKRKEAALKRMKAREKAEEKKNAKRNSEYRGWM